MSFAVVSDGSCDIPPAVAHERNIDTVPFYITFDRSEYLREVQDISVGDFYDRLLADPGLFPSTSLPSTADYYEVFSRHAAAGRDVLCVTISSRLSGSYNSASLAGQGIMAEYPGVEVRVVDSQVTTILQGLIVHEAADMRDAGLSLDETCRRLNDVMSTARIFFTIGTMEYLFHGGRLSEAARIANATLNVKPLVALQEGALTPCGAAIGRPAARRKIIDKAAGYITRSGRPPDDFLVCVGYGADEDEGREFREALAARLAGLGFTGTVDIGRIGATTGVHAGPHPIGMGIIRKYDA